MAKRGLRKGSKCIRKRRDGRCAKFSTPGGKGRRSGSSKKRKPKVLSFQQQMEERYKKTPMRLYAPASHQEKAEEPARARGKFMWSEGKWAPLAGLRRKRRRR